MSRLSKSRGFVGVKCGIVACIFTVHAAHSERAYLPSVGSPPLRFQAVTTNHFVFSLKSLLSAAIPLSASNAVTQSDELETNATNVVEISHPIPPISSSPAGAPESTNQVPVRPDAVTTAKINSAQPVNLGISSSTASDLLPVTPQMITEYLKPDQYDADQSDRPGTVTFVPPEMQFIPPTPKASTESRAIYKTQ